MRAGSREGELARARRGRRRLAQAALDAASRRRSATTGCPPAPVPGGERDAAAGPQHAARLAQRGLGVGERACSPSGTARASTRRASAGRSTRPPSRGTRRSSRPSSSARALRPRRPSPRRRRWRSARPPGWTQLGGEQARCRPARRRARAPSGRAAASIASTSHARDGRGRRLQRLAACAPSPRRRAPSASRLAARKLVGVHGHADATARAAAACPSACAAARRAKRDRLGDLEAARGARRQCARSSSAVRVRAVAQARRCATTASPHSRVGRGRGRAASATAGCAAQHGLDLGRRDVLAAGDDRVGLAAGDVQAPALVEARRGRRCAASRPRRRARPSGRATRISPSAAIARRRGSGGPASAASPGRAVVTCEHASVRP